MKLKWRDDKPIQMKALKLLFLSLTGESNLNLSIRSTDLSRAEGIKIQVKVEWGTNYSGSYAFR